MRSELLRRISAANPGTGVNSPDGRIAVIAHNHPSVSSGGAEISAFSLFQGLRELGADPIFIAACSTARRPDLELRGEDEHAVFFDEDGSYSYLYHVGNPSLVAQFADILRREKVGVASFHHFLHFGLGSIEAANDLGVRSFMTFHEYLSICHHHGQMVTRPDYALCTRATPGKCHRCYPEVQPGQFVQRREWLLRTLSEMQGFVSPSLFLKERLAEWGLPDDKICVIENGLVPRKAELAQAQRSDGRPWIFGYFGQINPFKGVDLLLDAAEMLATDEANRHIVIQIHGNIVGESNAFIERLRRSSNLPNCTYRGSFDNEDVTSLMSACDYVVAPSRWWENSPVVIQEAYRAGRPVIASDIGGLAEKVLHDETGFHFSVGSSADLARTMLKAAEPETFRRLQAGLSKPISHVEMARAYLDFMRAAEDWS